MDNIFVNKNINSYLKSELKKFDFTNNDFLQLEKINLCSFDFGNNFISNSLEDLNLFPNLQTLELSKYIINKQNIEVIENLKKITNYTFLNCDFKDDINIFGINLKLIVCQNISHINLNNFKNILIQNCDISNIQFENCINIELEHIVLTSENIEYINSLTSNISLVECEFDPNSIFNNNVTIIKKKLLIGGI